MASVQVGDILAVCHCYDCGWIGNRPDEAPGDTGWSIPPVPWTELLCPECAASLGNWLDVRVEGEA